MFIGDGVALVTAEAGEVSEKLSTFMLKVYFRIRSFFFFISVPDYTGSYCLLLFLVQKINLKRQQNKTKPKKGGEGKRACKMSLHALSLSLRPGLTGT